MSGNLGAKKWSTSSSRIDSDAEMKEAKVTKKGGQSGQMRDDHKRGQKKWRRMESERERERV